MHCQKNPQRLLEHLMHMYIHTGGGTVVNAQTVHAGPRTMVRGPVLVGRVVVSQNPSRVVETRSSEKGKREHTRRPGAANAI